LQIERLEKRNLKYLPDDFMFQLSKEEFKNLIFQIGTSSWGGTRDPPLYLGILSTHRLPKK